MERYGKRKEGGSSWPIYLVFFIVGVVVSSLIFTVLDFDLRASLNATKGDEASNAACTPETVYVPAECGSSGEGNGNIVRSIPIVAINQANQSGVMGKLTVKLIPGSSDVLVKTSPFLEPDLQYSANIAVAVAKNRTGIYADDKDVVLSYATDSNASLVGGGSAGAASTIAVMAALENKTIVPNIAITGTINVDGTIGPVSGVFEKAKAAADAGYKIFLVPEGQTTGTYYEQVTEKKEISPGFTYYYTYYTPKTIDLMKEAKSWGLEIREVSNIDEVAKLMIAQ